MEMKLNDLLVDSRECRWRYDSDAFRDRRCKKNEHHKKQITYWWNEPKSERNESMKECIMKPLQKNSTVSHHRLIVIGTHDFRITRYETVL